ncbi:hypothetical protein Pmani_006730 [Petrolisthes manimaculis]|uniref:Uncharacterized protein n=1 Tax=Petrolisthes manimaculis TaxID=1843537 RepID=A0AAE1UKT3_9EUCA|nr:hypothetical protein Pmani_006730 [Petrolisthes manimaculis]
MMVQEFLMYRFKAGAQNTPAVVPVATPAPLVNGSTVQGPTPVPVAGGVPLPGICNTNTTPRNNENPIVRSLPKTQFCLKSELLRYHQKPPPAMESLSIQSQPYRTLPLLQPSAKVRADLGVGSISHLKMQDDHISGLKEPQYVPQSHAMTAKAKHDELIMKQKGPHKKDNKTNNDFMKINKSTFRVGGQVVQLKKPLFDPDTPTDTDTQYPQLRKHSVGNLLTPNEHENERDTLCLATKRSGGRSRSLCYTVTTNRVEELDDDEQVTLSRECDESPLESRYPNEDQQVECTIKLNVPEVRGTSEEVEVEETVRLAPPPRPPHPVTPVETVSVSQTVKVRRDDYYYW